MMKFKCFVILVLVVSVQSASIYSKPIDIPVEVVYSEEIPYESHFIVPTQNAVGRKNLNEKIQLSPSQLRQLPKFEEDRDQLGHLSSLKNLNEKIQLSPEDLLQVDKHLPFPENYEVTLDVKSNSVVEASGSNVEVPENLNPSVNLEESNPPVQSSKPDESVFESLGETSPNNNPSTELPVAVSPTTEENLPDPNVVLLIQLAQNIVNNGLTNIRETIENLEISEQNSNKNPPISNEQWDRLNKTISSFFAAILDRGSLKGNNKETVLQDIVVGVRRVTNNFVENLRNEAANLTQPQPPVVNATQPQRPGVGQNIINLIASGFQGIASSLNNIRNRTTGSTVLGEKDQSTPAPGPFQNIVDQFGQAINQLNPFTQRPTAAPGSQGDEGSTPPNPFQNLANQVGQAINNLNPLNQLAGSQGSTAAPGAQNEGTTQGGPFQAVQDVFNQVGQAVNTIFTGGSTAAPGAENEEGSTPVRPFQQAFQNVVNAIGSLNPLNPTTGAPGTQNEGQTTAGGPLQGIFSQVGQAISGLNPLNQGSTAAPGSNPIQGVQNVINQVGQAVSTFNPLNPGSSPSPGNLVEGVQNAINQAGQAVSSLNPLNQVSTPSSGNVLEGVQNAINQAGQAVSSLNPLNQLSTPPSGNILEGAQNAINQVVSTRSPDSQGNPVGSVVETIQSVGSQIVNPKKQPSSEEKSKDSFAEEEIMFAVD